MRDAGTGLERVDVKTKPGDHIKLGNVDMTILQAFGHTPGAVSFSSICASPFTAPAGPMRLAKFAASAANPPVSAMIV